MLYIGGGPAASKLTLLEISISKGDCPTSPKNEIYRGVRQQQPHAEIVF